LSILATGSEDTTANELFDALSISEVNQEELAVQAENLFDELYRNRRVSKLVISNSLWMNQSLSFESAYTKLVSENFRASLFPVDFSSKKTPELMKEWVEEATNGMVSPNIQLEKNDLLRIMNTIYYNGQWGYRFHAKDNTSDDFHVTDQETVTCEFMNRTEVMGSYYKGEGFRAYRLYLEDGEAMILILPDEGVSARELAANKDTFACMYSNEDEVQAKIILSLPKFDYSYKVDLKEGLKALGIVEAFDQEKADFDPISKDNPYLSSATQELHIAIDETGVEAAAYTELGVKCGGALIEDLPTVELTFDRPFLYGIQNWDGIMLFAGIVNDPTKTN
jgi:serpin B